MAVWRSDRPDGRLHFSPSSDAANSGGGTIIWETDGPFVETIPFDSVIEAVSRGGARRIDLVKIDCEGSEFPILLTSSKLRHIDRIVGEYHELLAAPPEHAPRSPATLPSRCGSHPVKTRRSASRPSDKGIARAVFRGTWGTAPSERGPESPAGSRARAFPGRR